MKKILVFGIAGFSGRAFELMIANTGVSRDFSFIGIDIDVNRAANTGLVEYIAGNAFDKKFVVDVFSRYRPEYVVNLIGIFSADTFEMYYRGNLETTRHIFDSLIELDMVGCRCLVIGSAAEYGIPSVNPVQESEALRPMNLYGITKSFQTQLATYYHRNHGLSVVVARTFNILGQGQSERLAVGSFARQIAEAEEGGEIRVGNLEAFRDYLEIAEVVKAYWFLLLFGMPGEVYNVCSGVPTKMQDVLERMIDESGKKLRVIVDPGKFKVTEVPLIYGDNGKLESLMATYKKR